MTRHRLYPAGSRYLLRQAAKAADEETPHVMTHPLITCPNPNCSNPARTKEYYGPGPCPFCKPTEES